MSSPPTARADFDEYWKRIDDELANVDMAPEIDISPSRSTEFATSYDVRLTSSGPYRIFGYLSVPKGDGPFPGLYHAPRYGSVIKAPHYDERQRYVAFSLAHRGQRTSDSPWAAPYPGLLTEGIDSIETYVYGDILADVFRGAEFLSSITEVDPDSIGIIGDDLALIAAARRPTFAAAAIAAPMFLSALERAAQTEGYPVEEFNDYLRLFPEKKEGINATLSYFDPANHASNIECATVFSVSAGGSPNGPEWIAPLADSISGDSEIYSMCNEGGTDRDAIDKWLSSQLGAEHIPGLWTEAM